MVLGFFEYFPDRVKRFLIGSGRQYVMALVGDLGRDCSYLLGGFAGAIDHFGKTFAVDPVVVNFGKAKVLVALFFGGKNHCLLDSLCGIIA